MSIFATPFFSIQGQKERLTNVGRTLKAAFTGEEISAFTSSPRANAVLETAAENPLTTALIGAAAASPLTAARAAGAGLSALPTSGKVALTGAALVVTPAVIQNPKIAVEAGKAGAQLPRELAKLGSDVGEFSKNPTLENARAAIEESPVILGALVTAGAAATGIGIGSVLNAAATRENTAALRESNELLVSPVSPSLPAVAGPSNLPASQPVTQETQVLGRQAGGTPARRSRRKAAPKGDQRVSVRVVNQNNFIGGRVVSRQWSTSRRV